MSLKKLLFAAAFALLPSLAFGQGNPTCPTRPPGDNSNACASTAFVQNAVPSGITTYNVLALGAKCDGVTDDTAALKAIGVTISSAGGNARLVFPGGRNCLTFASGQSFPGGLGTLFDFSGGVSNVYVEGNGVTITNNHTFTGTDTLYNFYCQCSNFHFDGLNFVQTNAVTIPAPTPLGTVGIWSGAAGNPTDIVITNISMTGGESPMLFTNTQRIFVANVKSVNSIYGVATFNGTVRQLTVRNLSVTGPHDRAVFLKNIANSSISVYSQDAAANDILISSDQVNGLVEDVHIDYDIAKRTTGSCGSYVYIGTGSGSTAGTVGGSTFRNIWINFDADLSGETIFCPLIQFGKGTTNALGLSFENFIFTGRATGAPALAGNLFDLFRAADASWSGETAKNITFENMSITGSVTPAFFVDFAPFPTSPVGQFVLRNFSMTGNYTDANTTNRASQRFALNASFGNGNIVNEFNTSHLFNNTALPTFTSGQSVIGSSSTDGMIMAGIGSVNDFKFTNGSGSTICAVPTGTLQWNCPLMSVGGGSIGLATLLVTSSVTNSNQAVGLNVAQTQTFSSGSNQTMFGQQVGVTVNVSGATNSNAFGAFFRTSSFVSAGATLSEAASFRARSDLNGASPTGTITDLVGAEIASANTTLVTGTPVLTLTKIKGAWIRNQGISLAGVTSPNAYGIFTDAQSGSTANYAYWYDSASPTIIQATGGVSIGANTDPGAGGLYVNGATITLNALGTDATHTDRTVCQDTTSKSLFFGSGAAGICLGTSSERFKHDIHPLDAGLTQIMKLKAVSYKLNADRGDPNKVLYGFIAEQGVKVLPDLVGKDEQGHPQTFDYMGVVPVLVRAVQELKADNDNIRFELRRRSVR